MTTPRWLDTAVLLWATLLAALVFALMRDHAFDDPFITYRYAANLAAGHGLVYNPGLRILSTSAPLYALVLSPFAALGLPLPLVGILLGSLSLGAGAVALWRMAWLSGLPVAGMIAALLWPLSPLLLMTLGAETAPFIALVLWGFLLAWQGHAVAAGLLLALASLTRADAALAAALVAPLLLQREGLRPALRFSLAFMLLITPALLAARWYFGTPLPATLDTKQSQGQVVGSQPFLSGLGLYLVSLGRNPGFWPVLALAPLGMVAAVLRRGPLTLVLIWSLLHIIAYALLGVTAYFWYFGPAVTGLVVAAALGGQLLADGLTTLIGRRGAAAVVALVTTLTLLGHLQSFALLAQGTDMRIMVYRPAGLWLAANTPPDAQVAALEIGILGFYAERPMLDFAGLIQPDVAALFRSGGDYADAARYALEHYRPAYLVNQERNFSLVSVDPDLAAACHEVAAIPDPRFSTPLQIFHCVWD